jgi:glycosyltransferase involved in cell wall biosynthesis
MPTKITAGAQLRILMVAPQPFFRPRGTPFSVLHRIRALCKRGYQVELVTYPFGEDVQIPGLSINRVNKPPLVRDAKIGPSLAKLALDVPLYRETRRRASEGAFHVLHSHEEACFFSGALCRKHGLVHVYDMHSSLPQQLTNYKSWNLAPFRHLFESLERSVLTTCDGVITICQDLAEQALKSCGDTPHAMIENTADDQEMFGSDIREIRPELGLCSKTILLYTGSFEPYQGLDILLSAFARIHDRHPEAHLLLVGGRGPQVDECRKIASRLGITQKITFTGMVPPSAIPSYIATADIIVSPRSRGTNTPLKIYGYMRSGKPILASNRHTHTQTLDSTTSYLVEPSAGGIAEGMDVLLGNPELGRSLAAKARQLADEQYSEPVYMQKVWSFYENVLEHHARAGAVPIVSTAAA